MLNQKVDPVSSWDPYLRVTLTLTSKKVLVIITFFLISQIEVSFLFDHCNHDVTAEYIVFFTSLTKIRNTQIANYQE